MRNFNTSGACDPDVHYLVPPLSRLSKARDCIERREYFVVHAPPRTGKTTALLALTRELTTGGTQVVVHVECGRASVEDDLGRAELLLLDVMRHASSHRPEGLRPPDPCSDAPPGRRFVTALGAWARACPLPVVLLLDDLDTLDREVLNSVLRQLRCGFEVRGRAAFPVSVALCGRRHISDLAVRRDGQDRYFGEWFNIWSKSFRLPDFTEADVRALYAQHTEATGQAFTDGAVSRAWHWTAGQPWLVNRLANEVVHRLKVPVTAAVTTAHVDTAAERLIEAPETLNHYSDGLRKRPLHHLIGPLIAGRPVSLDADWREDVGLLRAAGVVAEDPPLRIANRIVREVAARVLDEDRIAAPP